MSIDISDNVIIDYNLDWFRELLYKTRFDATEQSVPYTITTADDASEVSKLKNALRRMATDIIKNYDYPISVDEFVNKYLEEENNNE